MILYLVTNNFIADTNKAFIEVIGIYNSREKAFRAMKANAMKVARQLVPKGDCSEEYECNIDGMNIDEFHMNESYFERQLDYDSMI